MVLFATVILNILPFQFRPPHHPRQILSNAEDESFSDVLRNIEQDKNANVVVCFCEGMTVRGLLKAMEKLNMTDRFLLIGSDGWADRPDVVQNYERQALGSISIRIHSPYVKSFDDYYFALNPFTNKRNPWFREFWEVRCHHRRTDGRPEEGVLFGRAAHCVSLIEYLFLALCHNRCVYEPVRVVGMVEQIGKNLLFSVIPTVCRRRTLYCLMIQNRAMFYECMAGSDYFNRREMTP